MRPTIIPLRTYAPPVATGSIETWKSVLIGQDHAIDTIAPYLDIFSAGLNPEGRPVGVFLLLGPTGTGKTHTVETLATVIHGSPRHVLTIHCGEYQNDHETAKLIGAPPGYLGHRETTPAISQQKLNAVTSDKSALSIVLFDEVEKAAPSLHRLLLGALDKAELKLGDNSTVNFERSLIFMTSNLGARDMQSLVEQKFAMTREEYDPSKGGRRACLEAAKKKFAPEFMNRIDETIHYNYLDAESVRCITGIQLDKLQNLLTDRLGARAPRLQVSCSAHAELCRLGFNRQYGARELKRVLFRDVIAKLARLVNSGQAAKSVTVDFNGEFVLAVAA